MMAALLLAMTMSLGLSAQNVRKQADPEKRIERRVEQLSKQLMLDDKTAARFAPLYKEYVAALRSCRVKPDKELKGDEAILDRLKARLTTREKTAATKQQYVDKFAKILTARQVSQLFEERDGRKDGRPARPARLAPTPNGSVPALQPRPLTPNRVSPVKGKVTRVND